MPNIYGGPVLNHACSDGHRSRDLFIGYVFAINPVHTQTGGQVVYRSDTMRIIVVVLVRGFYGGHAWQLLLFGPPRWAHLVLKGRFCTVL